MRQDTAIVVGDPSSILQYHPFKMRDTDKFTQKESDIIAHFIQISKSLQSGTWASCKPSYTFQDKVTSAQLPDQEPMSYAMLCFRQMIEDKLFEDTVKIILAHLDCNLAVAWLSTELRKWENALSSPSLTFNDVSNHELLKTYYYGYSIFHRVHGNRKVNEEMRKKLHEILGFPNLTGAAFEEKRVSYVFWVDMTMRSNFLNIISSVNFFIYHVFSDWLSRYSLKSPDIIWHNSLNENIEEQGG